MNLVEIFEPWRGAELGLCATDLVIDELHTRADLAALYPMPPGLTDVDEREPAHQGLCTYWARIGFEEYDEIMVRVLSD